MKFSKRLQSEKDKLHWEHEQLAEQGDITDTARAYLGAIKSYLPQSDVAPTNGIPAQAPTPQPLDIPGSGNTSLGLMSQNLNLNGRNEHDYGNYYFDLSSSAPVYELAELPGGVPSFSYEMQIPADSALVIQLPEVVDPGNPSLRATPQFLAYQNQHGFLVADKTYPKPEAEGIAPGDDRAIPESGLGRLALQNKLDRLMHPSQPPQTAQPEASQDKDPFDPYIDKDKRFLENTEIQLLKTQLHLRLDSSGNFDTYDLIASTLDDGSDTVRITLISPGTTGRTLPAPISFYFVRIRQ